MSEEIKVSLVSKECLIRLKVLDPNQFLSDKEVRSFSVNTVEDIRITEQNSKLSDCEKSFFKNKDGSMGCLCERRTAPPDFDEQFYEEVCDHIMKNGGENVNSILSEALKRRFKGSSMNLCQTQPLPIMKVPEMIVELKDEYKNISAKKTTRVIPTPLALRDQTQKDLDNAVRKGILEEVSGDNNHDLWLAPMIVVPKRDNTPRRVVDFSTLNRFCKRSAEATMDTQRMATAVPVPELSLIHI